jgi:endonuclease YncB( thermonuclease family)
MRPTSFRKGAPGTAAPFFFVALCTSLLATVVLPVSATECPAARIDERVQVVYVYDGDTVKLADGRRVRLIGINTPEMAREGEAGEPLAQAARASVQDMLNRGNRVLQLQYGTQHNDHYGRLLAHAYLDSGENLSARLLQQGLATALVVPPNTRAMDCYQRLGRTYRPARPVGTAAVPDAGQHRTAA